MQAVPLEPLAEHVGESEGHQPGQGVPFGRRHVGHSLKGRRIPNVPVVGSHVEVAHHHYGLVGWVGVGNQVIVQAPQPVQLVAVVVVVDLSPVGYVAARHPHAAAGRPEDPGIGIGICSAIGEPRTHVG